MGHRRSHGGGYRGRRLLRAADHGCRQEQGRSIGTENGMGLIEQETDPVEQLLAASANKPVGRHDDGALTQPGAGGGDQIHGQADRCRARIGQPQRIGGSEAGEGIVFRHQPAVAVDPHCGRRNRHEAVGLGIPRHDQDTPVRGEAKHTGVWQTGSGEQFTLRGHPPDFMTGEGESCGDGHSSIGGVDAQPDLSWSG